MQHVQLLLWGFVSLWLTKVMLDGSWVKAASSTSAPLAAHAATQARQIMRQAKLRLWG
jgi:hypothetical protein